MKRLLLLFALIGVIRGSLSPLPCYAVDNDQRWVTQGDLDNLMRGFNERGMALDGTAFEWSLFDPPNTNWIWSMDLYWGYFLGIPFDNALATRIVPRYVAIDAGTDFHGKPHGAITNWSPKRLHDYLATTFVNTDGTAGVGTWQNDTWYWTQTWQTSAWSICLGSLTYAVTNIYTTNGVQHWACGWIFQDGDRIVKRGALGSQTDPSQIPWDFKRYIGNVFDWADESTFANSVRVELGSTNWNTLASGLTLTLVGRTNYLATYYDVGDEEWDPAYGGQFTNTLDVSGAGTNYSGAPATRMWDVDSLSIPETQEYTNWPVVNHVGDRISIWLNIGGRFYIDPSRSVKKGATQSWITREMINERLAILGALRVTDSDSTHDYRGPHGEDTEYTVNWVASMPDRGSYESSTTSWADAQGLAVASYAPGFVFPHSGPYAVAKGAYDAGTPLWTAELYRRAGYLSFPPRVHPYDAGFSNAQSIVFYAYVDTYSTNAGSVFDGNGDFSLRTNWVAIGTASIGSGSTNNVHSDTIGDSSVLPNPCTDPTPYSDNGYVVKHYKAITTWSFLHATNAP